MAGFWFRQKVNGWLMQIGGRNYQGVAYPIGRLAGTTNDQWAPMVKKLQDAGLSPFISAAAGAYWLGVNAPLVDAKGYPIRKVMGMIFHEMSSMIARGAEGSCPEDLDKACQVIGLESWEDYDVEKAISSP
jgi:hypothetical protein